MNRKAFFMGSILTADKNLDPQKGSVGVKHVAVYCYLKLVSFLQFYITAFVQVQESNLGAPRHGCTVEASYIVAPGFDYR